VTPDPCLVSPSVISLAGARVETAAVAPALAGAAARGVLWQAAPGSFLLEAPDVARYLVAEGQTITVQPMPGAGDAEVARFLVMAPLAALWYQRGALVFHAAAAAPAGEGAGAILIAGGSGAGKSTLLAALAQRGWRPLADDLAVVELDERSQPVVLPNPSPIRLWLDAREKLAWHEADEAPAVSAPLPLRAIYWLGVHHRDGIELTELAGAQRFQALGALSYNSHIADALLDRAVYLRKAGRVAQVVPLRRLRGRWSAPELAGRLSEEVRPLTADR
jgi:hypothetical protein